MNSKDFVQDAFFTTNGKDIWKLESFCMSPSCRLKNLETGKVEDFGLGGITAQEFHRIIMPKEIVEKEKKRAAVARQRPLSEPQIF